MQSAKTASELSALAYRLRRNVLEMIGVGKAGHLGGSNSLAEIVATLYFSRMRFDPKNIHDPDRDRFLLSKGHAVLIQYSALVELGVISRDEVPKVKTLAGILQGHPDMAKTPGIEAVTGSLGQGLSIGVGMALGLRLDGRSSRVYVIMGDGELAEGQLWESAMAAARFKVDNLTAFLDRNSIQATGPVKDIFEIPAIEEKWIAFGWNVILIDGHNPTEILSALDSAEKVKGKPSLIIANTVKGKGVSFAENTAAFHNGILTKELYEKALSDVDSVSLALANGTEVRK
ncbi:MAG TPA: transketolase [Spirochaetia bacterium]|nr:transketolase [Spirochaetia bacterium]